MKITDWMTISTVEHRGHCFKYYIAKSRCKIIVSLLAIKSDLSTKRDPLEFSNSMELNISEIAFSKNMESENVASRLKLADLNSTLPSKRQFSKLILFAKNA